jgi:vacuolar protein sorting-associated protein 54
MKEILSRIDSSSLRTTFSDILFAATELAHNRVSKVIGIRAEENSKLKLREFHAFFEESMAFVVDSEILCQKMVVGLRGVLGGQVIITLVKP